MKTKIQLPVTDVPGRHRVVVRARGQSTRIAEIWQVLLPFSDHVEKVDIRMFINNDLDEVTIAFFQTHPELLDSIVERFNNMSWVTNVQLCKTVAAVSHVTVRGACRGTFLARPGAGLAEQ